MSEDRMEPLDAEVLALLEAERQRPEMPSAVQERLLRRLERSIASDGGGLGKEPPADDAPSGGLGRFLGRRIPFGLTAFTLGGLVGAGIHAALTRPAPAPPVISAPAVTTPASTPAPSPAEPSAPSAVSPVAPAPPRRPVRTAPAQVPAAEEDGEPDTELAAERALVETARTAMSRGDVPGALETLERAARKFPKGRLVEERESLRVTALAKLGRLTEARALGARFRKEFPASMLLPMVDEALKTIP